MAEFKEAWFHRFKAAQRDLIKACGGIERCSEIVAVSKSQVGRWNNAQDIDLMPLNVVYVLESECGIAFVTKALASLNGRSLEENDKPNHKNTDIMTTFADTVHHTSELMKAGIDALADGKITPNEATRMDREAASLEKRVAILRNGLANAKQETLHIARGTVQ